MKPSNFLGPQLNSIFSESLLAIRCSLFFLFFALLIFLFNSAILFSIHLFFGILVSIDSNDFSDSFSFSIDLTIITSLFIDLIFFLLKLAFILWVVLVILFSNPSIWDFKLSISFDKFFNSLFNLEFLFLLCFRCILFRATAKGCRTSNSGSRNGRFLLLSIFILEKSYQLSFSQSRITS